MDGVGPIARENAERSLHNKMWKASHSKGNVIGQIDETTYRSSVFIGVLAAIRGIYAEVPQERKPYSFGDIHKIPDSDDWPYGSIITLKDLGMSWSGDRNYKKLGISWEYALKYGIEADNSVLGRQPVLREYLNRAIEECPPFSDSDVRHKAVLWGVDKEEDIVSRAQGAFGEGATLWTPGGGRPVKIKNHLEAARDSAKPHSEEARQSLPESAREVWKADLFIKRKGTDKWLGASVKHRPELFKNENHKGLSLGISRGDPNKVKLREPYWDEDQKMAKVQIPYEHKFGEGFMTGFNIVKRCLELIPADEATAEEIADTFSRGLANFILGLQERAVLTLLREIRSSAVWENAELPSEIETGRVRVIGESSNVAQPAPGIPAENLN